MTDILQRVAAKGLVVNGEGKVLILREANTYEEGTNIGRFGLPGGRIDPGELFYDGLAREIREECGLAVQPLKPLYVGEWFPTIKGVKNHITAIFVACTATDQEITLSEEHDSYEWINPAQYHDYDMMDPDDKVIQAWLDHNARPFPSTLTQ